VGGGGGLERNLPHILLLWSLTFCCQGSTNRNLKGSRHELFEFYVGIPLHQWVLRHIHSQTGPEIRRNMALTSVNFPGTSEHSSLLHCRLSPSKTEGILRKFQKVIQLTQKWKDIENNGTTWKLVSIPFKWVPICCGVSIESSNYQYFFHSDFGDKSRLPFLKG
jgi:hypothetical protein